MENLFIFLMPTCFALLFILMLLYWGQTAFFSFIKYKKTTSFVFYLTSSCLTLLLLLRWFDSGHLPLSNLYESLIFLSWSFLSIQAMLQLSNISTSNTLQTFLPVLTPAPDAVVKATGASKDAAEINGGGKSFKQATAQLTAASESFFYDNTRITTRGENASLVAELNETKNKDYKKTQLELQTEKQELLDLIAVIFSPMSLLTYTFAFLNLPKEMQKATALVPALQSNWLMMHVSVMILSYAALLSGCLLAITYLFFNSINSLAPVGVSTQTPLWSKGDLKTRNLLKPAALGDSTTKSKKQLVSVNQASSETLDSFETATVENKTSTLKLALSEKLDNYSYRLIGVGFPLLTIGILSGAVWANSAWGSYWSWDPKETWALITWLFFAIYLHARITRGWSGKKAALIATVAFFVVWFCFLGVNLLGSGLHSYGWFKN